MQQREQQQSRNTCKERRFPFAHQYLGNFDLPEDFTFIGKALNRNDIDRMVQVERKVRLH